MVETSYSFKNYKYFYMLVFKYNFSNDSIISDFNDVFRGSHREALKITNMRIVSIDNEGNKKVIKLVGSLAALSEVILLGRDISNAIAKAIYNNLGIQSYQLYDALGKKLIPDNDRGTEAHLYHYR